MLFHPFHPLVPLLELSTPTSRDPPPTRHALDSVRAWSTCLHIQLFFVFLLPQETRANPLSRVLPDNDVTDFAYYLCVWRVDFIASTHSLLTQPIQYLIFVFIDVSLDSRRIDRLTRTWRVPRLIFCNRTSCSGRWISRLRCGMNGCHQGMLDGCCTNKD